MPEFPAIRPNATKWELTQAQMDEYRSVTEMYVFCTGRIISQMVNATLLACYKHCGAEKTNYYIERWVMLGYHSLDSLVGLCKGEIPTERIVQKQKADETPGKGRVGGSASTKPLAEFLSDNPEKILKPAPKIILKPGQMLRDAAQDWMIAHHPNDLDFFDQYFTLAGVMNGQEIYQLIVRQ